MNGPSEGPTQWVNRAPISWDIIVKRQKPKILGDIRQSLPDCPNYQRNTIATSIFQTSNTAHLIPTCRPWEASGGCSIIYLEFGSDEKNEKNPSLTCYISLGKLFKLSNALISLSGKIFILSWGLNDLIYQKDLAKCNVVSWIRSWNRKKDISGKTGRIWIKSVI